MFDLIGRSFASPRRAALVVALWVVVGIVIVATAPPLSDVTTNNQEDFLPSDAESLAAIQLVKERYPRTGGTPGIVVFHRPDGLTTNDAAIVARATSELEASDRPPLIETVLAVDGSPQLDSSLKSPDGRTVMTFVTFSGSPADPKFGEAVQWVRQAVAGVVANTGLIVAVTGPAGIISDAIRVFESIDFRVTLFTVLLVLALMLLIYRSPALALLPLAGVGWTLFVAQGLAATLADNAALPLTGQVTALMSVLVFGAGTDFTLFIVSRYREELLTTESRWVAMRTSVASVGPAITSSAGTTIAAMLALLLASLGSFRALGPTLSIAIGLMLLSGLTLIPALALLLGPLAFWPRRLSGSGTSRVWSATADAVVRRPVVTLVSTLVVLVAFAAGAPSMKLNFSFIDGFPDDTDSKIGAQILDESFGAGELAPTTVFIEVPSGNVFDYLSAIDDIGAAIAELPGVDKVSGPSRPGGQTPDMPVAKLQAGIAGLPAAVREAIAGGGPPPVAGAMSRESRSEIIAAYAAGRRFVSPDDSVARLDVVMADDPYGLAALDRVSLIRQAAQRAANDAGLGVNAVLVGGATAVQTDTRDAVNRDITIVGPIVIGLIWLILLALLRSPVAASYLVGSVMLSFVAALGISVVIFQNLMGHPGVGYQNGVWMFIFLAALGADYNILIMSRVREEIRRRGTVEGTRFAVARTGGVITSAGIILAGAFSILTTLPLRDVFQLGFAVALGVLIDTFVVRALLVPSIVLVLKDWNWWPYRHATVPAAREVSRPNHYK